MNNDFDATNQIVTSGGMPTGSKKRTIILGIAAVVILAVIGVVGVILHKTKAPDNGQVVAISNVVANVSITSSGYTPKTLTIKQGQQVTFTNNDATPRQLSADPTTLPGFNTVEPLDKGDTYTYIFDTKGTFKYYDATNPTQFVGTITVK